MRRGTRRGPILVGALVVLTSLPFATPVAAAVSLTALGTPYTQSFDSLPASGSATWTNNSTIADWFQARTGTGSTIVAQNGSSNAGNLYSYGTGTATDRALGSLGSGNAAVGNLFWGVQLANNTGSTITQLDVSYTGEQWRNSLAAAQTVSFSYLVGSPTVTGTLLEFQSPGVAVPQLDFTSPITGGVTAGAIDGNLATNRVPLTHSITGLTIPNGTEVMLRWSDPDHTGADHGLSIDDFSVTPQGGGDAAPFVSSTIPNGNDTGVAVDANISVTFSEPVGVAASWYTISCATSGAHTAAPSGSSPTFTLNPDNDFAPGEVCTVTIENDQVTDQDAIDPPNNMAADYVFDFTTAAPSDVCGDAYTPIHDIQGNGASTPIPGDVTTEGIVVGDFEGPTSSGLQGFYIHEPSQDANPETSEGIFVFTSNTNNNISAGDRVRVSGFARERFGETALNGSDSDTAEVTDIDTCSTGNPLPAATVVTLPFESATEPERWEGMNVKLTQALVISETFTYTRFGEVMLALPLAGETRPFGGTAIDEPGAPANARTAANLLRRITLDDGLAAQNPSSLRHPNGSPFSLTNYFRAGDTVTDTVGVLGFGFSLYRIQPNGAATYTAANPRPAAPGDTGGRITVAVQNTLNFFLTLDQPSGTGDNVCGGNQNLECRGADADQPDEFNRQRDKLLSTLIGLDADVIGLNEIENTPGVDPLANIVAGLNDELGAGTYAYIDTGVIGTDAIRVGIIYRPAAVTPAGAHAILDSTVDPDFIDTKSRPVLAQTFEENSTGAKFTVAVNHLKSKGSACTDVSDPDLGDGQGNCNGTRTKAAQALVDWLATDPTASGDPDVLIIGDLNSYAKEDPIDAIKVGANDVAGGGDDYTNLVEQFIGTYAYSYVFDGQSGYLDHALSTDALTGQVTGIAEWHSNADETSVFDYDMNFKPPAQDALYEPAAYRSSDHDGVIVGLDLAFTSAAPVTSDVEVHLDEGGQVQSVPVHITWQASDDQTATEDLNHEVQRRRLKGNTWQAWMPLVTTGDLEAVAQQPLWRWYQYRVRSQDEQGNWGEWVEGAPIRAKRREQSIKFSSTDWTRVAQPGAMSGDVHQSSTVGAWARVRFQVQEVALVMPAGAGQGTVEVCIDPDTAAEECRTINLATFSPTGNRRLVTVFSDLGFAKHVLRVEVVSGTVNFDGAMLAEIPAG